MNVLIAYAGKTGTTEKCAKILKALVDDSTLCNLSKESPDVSQYDCIIIGSSIRSGLTHKDVKQFIKKNHEVLLKKKCGYFICNCFKDKTQEYLEKNIPEELLKKALATASFGGEINNDKYKSVDKLMVKAIENGVKDSGHPVTSVSSEAIQRFAKSIRNY